jgi:hypothetical protein
MLHLLKDAHHKRSEKIVDQKWKFIVPNRTESCWGCAVHHPSLVRSPRSVRAMATSTPNPVDGESELSFEALTFGEDSGHVKKENKAGKQKKSFKKDRSSASPQVRNTIFMLAMLSIRSCPSSFLVIPLFSSPFL